MRNSLFDTLKKIILTHGCKPTYWLALSGGLDSTVLLDLLVNLRSLHPIQLHAIHIHHGLSPNADAWVKHCEKICHDYSVTLTVQHVDATASSGQSPEEVARQLRYAAFVGLMAPNDVLLTAHHQDDQAETVLLQLMRGAGPKGLAAMPRSIEFQQGFHLRPLLDFSRETLQSYAEYQQLVWIEDESNRQVTLTRNFIRHEVMPLLKSRWPSVTETLSRVADHCAEAQTLLDEFVSHQMTACQGPNVNTLSVEKLLQFNEANQRQILRAWLRQQHVPLPSTIKMQHIMHDVLRAREDKLPHVVWGGTEIRRYRDVLYVMPYQELIDTSLTYHWNLQTPLRLATQDVLSACEATGIGLRGDITAVDVRFRQGGEVCQLPGRKHHHELKKLFQAWGVPPWQRDRIPLLYLNDQLIAVVGYFIADGFAASKNEKGWQLQLVPSSPLGGDDGSELNLSYGS